MTKTPKAKDRDVNRAAPPAILLTNIKQLLTLRGSGEPRRGKHLSDLGILEDAAVLCAAGKIVSVGTRREAQRDGWLRKNPRKVQEIDCKGGVVLPGFVDSHTHPVFTHPRLVDFEKRISGATYDEIAESGGGIRSSLEGVRKATLRELAGRVVDALKQMASSGTTTVETKSGYGLSFESEIKSLEAIREAARQWPGTVVSTLLAAHVVPPEFREKRQDYVDLVREKLIPGVARRKLAVYVDVFCERGAFTMEETQAIFSSAREHALGVRAHVCQLTEESLQPLAEFSPASYDHMDCVLEPDLKKLATVHTVATLLPGANYFLGLSKYAPARKLIDSGVAVALATDYNPGTSPTLSMPFVLSLACTHMKMSPAESITAATYNGACALRLQHRKGSIEPAKDADIAIFNVADYREIPYWIAAETCAGVIANGAFLPSPISGWDEFE